MPNWIEGTLKLRGSSEDLIRFFEKGFEDPVSERTDCSDGVSFVVTNFAYIKGSRRAFALETFECYIYTDYDHNQVALIPVKQAWSFTPSADEAAQRWIDLAKEYNLDVRLQGFERGIEFYQDVEIVNGELVRCDCITYEDWDWECPMPRMGG